ncbi:MAG TPA: hypothetical protein VFG37_15790 [Planctomycetota bacterium]|jgi:hypothetical protein|nr:hypothetical protein [Planctomycetota bacterium]
MQETIDRRRLLQLLGIGAGKEPIPWDPAAPDKGLGSRRVTPRADDAAKRIVEREVRR